jgi:hypothetical protein
MLAGLASGGGLVTVAAPELAVAESRMRAAVTRIDTARLGTLPLLEDDGRWTLDGSRTFAAWLARRDGVTRKRANAEVRAATRMRADLPASARAALEGTLGVDELTAMVDITPTSAARRAALAAPVVDADVPPGGDGAPEGTGAVAATPSGEEYLLSFAGTQPIGAFQRLLRRFAHVADPEADERGYRRAAEREFLDLAPTWGGYHVAGFLTTEHGQLLRTAFDALMTPGVGAGAETVTAAGAVGGDGTEGGTTGTAGGTTGDVPARPPATATPAGGGQRTAAGDQRTAAGDQRTVQQRRAQALADLARVVLDGGLVSPGASVRPHVTVHVSWTELQRVLAAADRRTAPDDVDADVLDVERAGDGDLQGSDSRQAPPRRSRPPGLPPERSGGVDPPPGISARALTDPEAEYATWADDVGPVPAELLAKIACDAEVTRVVFGPDSQVLDVGRARRTVTGQLRRAVIARDRHCTWPGCQEPPARCEVHHAVTHWADGGMTSVDNAALLCWHHHTVVDTQGVTMRWERDRWTFADRHGRAIATAPAGPARPAAQAADRAA